MPIEIPAIGAIQQHLNEIEFVSARSGQVIYGVMKKFEELTEREVLALAIALEEEDERVYADFCGRIAAGLSRHGVNV